jgi:hypothetical protein
MPAGGSWLVLAITQASHKRLPCVTHDGQTPTSDSRISPFATGRRPYLPGRPGTERSGGTLRRLRSEREWRSRCRGLDCPDRHPERDQVHELRAAIAPGVRPVHPGQADAGAHRYRDVRFHREAHGEGMRVRERAQPGRRTGWQLFQVRQHLGQAAAGGAHLDHFGLLPQLLPHGADDCIRAVGEPQPLSARRAAAAARAASGPRSGTGCREGARASPTCPA